MEGISIRQTLILGCVVPLKELKQIADLYAVKVIDAANKANVGGPPARAKADMLQAQQEIAQVWRQ
ncbi:MAG: hypothetical protein ACRCR1_11970 [Aeromonas sp.]